MTISTPTISGQILTSAYVNNNINSGLVYVTSVTVGSAVLTVNVPNAFSAEYDNYRIVLSNIDCSVDGNGIKLLLDGFTTAVYSSSTVSSAYSGAAPTGSGYVNDAGGILVGQSSTLNDVHSVIDIFKPFVAARKTYTFQNSQQTVVSSGGGYINSSASATGFTIDLDAAATMTGGTITCYGYRKA